MSRESVTLLELVIKTAVAHTVTYFLAGVVAFFLFDYTRLFAETELRFLMRPVSDPMVAAGPLFQPIRGALFGLLFYVLRDSWMGLGRGWLVLWVMLVIVGVIGTFGPASGGLEGMIYTKIPLSVQLKGLPEVVVQPLLLSLIIWYWVPDRGKKGLDWGLGIAFLLVLLMSILGLLSARAKVTPTGGPGAASVESVEKKAADFR